MSYKVEDEYIYQVNSNQGAWLFDTEKDGINALRLAANFHEITIDEFVVRGALRTQGFCEQYWPCTIERCKNTIPD